MAKVHFKVVAPQTAVYVNIIQGKFDNLEEIRHPSTVCVVNIPKGELRTVFINAIGLQGSRVILRQDDTEIFNELIGSDGALGKQIIIRA